MHVWYTIVVSVNSKQFGQMMLVGQVPSWEAVEWLNV